jgi:hypothetical protein
VKGERSRFGVDVADITPVTRHCRAWVQGKYRSTRATLDLRQAIRHWVRFPLPNPPPPATWAHGRTWKPGEPGGSAVMEASLAQSPPPSPVDTTRPTESAETPLGAPQHSDCGGDGGGGSGGGGGVPVDAAAHAGA